MAALAASRRARTGASLVGVGTVLIVLALVMIAFQIPARAQVPPADNPNEVVYWQNMYTDHDAVCYKHDPPGTFTVHGALNAAGTAVILNPFNPAWPGDHWEALIVKAGSSGGDDGNGNAIYYHPSAGVEYFAPLNSGGQQATVSHWIVCKGTYPDDTTTTSSTTTTTTEPPTTTSTTSTTTTTSTTSTTTTTSTTSTTSTTTTTTQPPTTTSTLPPDTTSTTSTSTTTTSTLPPDTTSTTSTSTTTTTDPSTTTTSTLPPDTTTTSTLPPELPRTGGEGNPLVVLVGGLGIALLGAGLLIVAEDRRRLVVTR